MATSTQNIVEEPIQRNPAVDPQTRKGMMPARAVTEEPIEQRPRFDKPTVGGAISVTPSDRGFTQGVKRGALNLIGTIHQFGSDLANPAMPVLLSDKPEDRGSVVDRLQGESILGRYVLQPAANEKRRSLEEAQAFHNTSGLPAVGHALNSYIHTAGEFVPLIGPIVGNLVDRAEGGDVSGSIGEGLTYAAALRILRGVGAKGLEVARDIPGVRAAIPTAEGLGRTIGRNTPPSIARPAIRWAEGGVKPVVPEAGAQTSAASPPTVGSPYAKVDAIRAKLTSPGAMAARPWEGNAPAQMPVGPYGSVDQIRAKLTSPAALASRLKGVEAPAETPGNGSAPIVPERVSDASTKAPSIAKPEASSVKPVKPEPTSGERRTGYLFGEHSDAYDPENLEHRKIKDMTHEELAQAANERGLKGRTNWNKEDFSRSIKAHGKSSNPNASMVRGRLLEEAINTDRFLKTPKEYSRPLKEMEPNLDSLWQENVFGKKPEADVGHKVRATNPEPTRAEVKKALKKSLTGNN